MEKIRIRDPGWKKVGFVIRNPVKHTESATLVTIAAGGISTATFPSPLVCSQQPLLLSQEHYSRIAITTAASNHSHNSGWRPHNSNLRRPRKNYKLGTAFFFLVLNFVVGSQL
jgi:hypothetical protein